MKILYLCHPEQDYGEYYLFNGLCQVLGDNNVVTFPFKRSYYGMIDNEYILDDGNKGFTAPGEYIVAREKNEWNLDEVINRMSEFDLIVLTSGRTYAVNALRELIGAFGRTQLPPLAFTEHEDGDNVRWDIIREFEPQVIFKRELLRDFPQRNIHSLPFSSAINGFPKADDQTKEYDLFALLGMTWPLRLEIIEQLLEYDYPNAYLGVDTKKIRGDYQEKNKSHIGYKEYLEGIAKSKIAISVRGHGRDTVRRWEIPAYETLMLICDPGILVPHDFEDGKTAVFFKEDLSDLKEKIDYYLAHDDERIAIAKAGQAHLKKYHTNKARAQYFLDVVKSNVEVAHVN